MASVDTPHGQHCNCHLCSTQIRPDARHVVMRALARTRRTEHVVRLRDNRDRYSTPRKVAS
jgi:hypothetical protein